MIFLFHARFLAGLYTGLFYVDWGKLGVSLCTFSDMIDLYHYSIVYTATCFLGNKDLHYFLFRCFASGFVVTVYFLPLIPEMLYPSLLILWMLLS